MDKRDFDSSCYVLISNTSICELRDLSIPILNSFSILTIYAIVMPPSSVLVTLVIMSPKPFPSLEFPREYLLQRSQF